jgi:hypothetical protein
MPDAFKEPLTESRVDQRSQLDQLAWDETVGGKPKPPCHLLLQSRCGRQLWATGSAGGSATPPPFPAGRAAAADDGRIGGPKGPIRQRRCVLEVAPPAGRGFRSDTTSLSGGDLPPVDEDDGPPVLLGDLCTFRDQPCALSVPPSGFPKIDPSSNELILPPGSDAGSRRSMGSRVGSAPSPCRSTSAEYRRGPHVHRCAVSNRSSRPGSD